MLLPINDFTIHNIVGFMVTGSLAAMFYIVYLKAGRRLLDLLAANFILCAAVACLVSFLTDNLIPVGMSSMGWPNGPTAEQLRSATLEIHRWAWVGAIFILPSQLHFVLCYCQKQNWLRRYVWVWYAVATAAVVTLWTDLWIRLPEAPMAETSSWGSTIPWLPDIGPAAPLLVLSFLTVEIYSLVQLWRTRKVSSTDAAESLSPRRIVFAAFAVQLAAGLGDVVASALELPLPAMVPAGGGIMGVLLAIALIRSRMEADRARFQLKSEKAAMLDCVPQPLLYLGSDSRVQWANKNAAELAGRDLDNLLGSRIDEVWAARHAELLPAEEALKTGAMVRREIVRDESTWIVHASPVMDNKGKPTGAIEVATNITDIRRAQKALQESQIKILTAREEERRRVAQDLHDSVAQGLTALQMQLRARSAEVGADTSAGEQFIQASVRCQKLGTEVRQISHQLYPPALDLLGFVAALEEILEQYESIGIECGLECTEELRQARFNQNVEVAMYRTVQEAMNNANRHGHAKRITIQLTEADGDIQLTVTDNGAGFDVAAGKAGLGMTSMSGRIENIAGKLHITSEPGRTCVCVSVPVEKAARTEAAESAAQALVGTAK